MPPLVTLLMLTVLSSPAEAKLPQSLDLGVIRALPVQHDGRWMPLDTVARDLVREVTGESRFRGADPVVVLLAWTFDPRTWMQEPVIIIRNAELRVELGLPADKKVYSFVDLVGHEPLLKLMDGLDRRDPDRKPDPLEIKVQEIVHRLTTLRDLFGGQVINVIPDAQSSNGAWRPVQPASPHASSAADPVRDPWFALSTAFTKDDATGFAAAADQLTKGLAALPAAYLPSRDLLATELHYNALRPFRTAWIILAIGAAFAAAALAARRRWFDVVAALPLVAGLAVLSYGLWLRWQIAGRIPASNMYESLLLLGWGMALFAILARFVFTQRLVLLTASGMAALSLFLADVLPLDPFIRPIVPVLRDTYWMSIHVPVIMVSYSVLALGVLVAHVQLGAMALAPQNRRLVGTIDSLHYWYIHVGSILLTAGIFTGSMWAASSWGRYWGWDPKEVWSLVALLGYLTILHVRVSPERIPAWAYVAAAGLAVGVFTIVLMHLWPPLPAGGLALAATLGAVVAIVLTVVGAAAYMVLARGLFATAVKSIVCFWLVIMTYLGVNYVLGTGLHSYGFGTGAVVRYMFITGIIDLLLIAVFGAVYGYRRVPAPSPAAA